MTTFEKTVRADGEEHLAVSSCETRVSPLLIHLLIAGCSLIVHVPSCPCRQLFGVFCTGHGVRQPF